MKKTIQYIIILIACLSGLSACDLLESHPYAVDVKYKHLNNEAIKQVEALCAGKETIRFVWMGDSQRWYDETEDFVKHANQRDDIDFVLHGGDISDFGMQREFEWVHEDMRKLNVPYIALVGNHDMLGNGHQVYEKMYGELNFSFIAGKVKFVCVNTNALEFDYSHAVPDFNFLHSELKDTLDRQYDKTIVAMHADPFGEQFNNNVASFFQDFVNRCKGIQFCMHAHTYKLYIRDLFEDGIIYYGCASMKERSYFVFTITPDDYTYEVVYF